MTKIVKATAAEREAYRATKPVYPLFGYLTMDGVKFAVEDLREWDKENPQYEAMCPEGYHFRQNGTHSLLGLTQKDLINRVRCDSLEKCTEDCR